MLFFFVCHFFWYLLLEGGAKYPGELVEKAGLDTTVIKKNVFVVTNGLANFL